MFAFFSLVTLTVVSAEPPSVHSVITIILSLLVVVVALAVVAPYLKIPYPILLVFGGLLLGFIPGLPQVTLNPDLIFLLFLPPLLYSSAWSTSWRDFRANLRPISLLAIGLVLFTTTLVAIVAHTLIPGFPLAAAFVLGAIISPTDAIAATSIAQRLGVPRRIVTIIEGESLVNDASGLVAYQFAVAAVVTGTFSLGEASLRFVIDSVGGIAIGLAIGLILTQVHRVLNNPSLEITITLLTPYVAYLIADRLGVSGVLATVTAGLYLAWRAPVLFSADTRQQAFAVWNNLTFLLNGLVFIFIGLQLRGILDTLRGTIAQRSIANLLWYAAVVCIAVIVVRMVWVFPATYLPRLLSSRVRKQDPLPDWKNIVIIAWTGMRGVVSLASAFAIPLMTQSGSPFPERALILFLTFCVIFVTLVLQGLSLPFLIHRLGLKDDGGAEREEVQARKTAAQAALDRINALIEEGNVPKEVAEHLRTHYEARYKSIVDASDGQEYTSGESHLATYQYLQQETLKAEHDAVIAMRSNGDISDEVFRHIERELDLDEQRLEGERK